MKKSRFTETQIVSILKVADAGVPVKDICRKHGISKPTYFNWKSKYGGMEASGRPSAGKSYLADYLLLLFFSDSA